MSRRPRRRRGGFTLVEVAVTIVIVGIGLTLVLQALNTATTSAAQTRNMKFARDLGLLTLGQVSSGLYRDEIRERFYGTYGEEGYPEFEFEVALGDEVFDEQPLSDDPNAPFDNWRHSEELAERDASDEDEEAEQPYEKIKVKVSFPQLREYRNYLILESWVPWDQVYGPDEDDELQQEGGPS